MLDERDLIN